MVMGDCRQSENRQKETWLEQIGWVLLGKVLGIWQWEGYVGEGHLGT